MADFKDNPKWRTLQTCPSRSKSRKSDDTFANQKPKLIGLWSIVLPFSSLPGLVTFKSRNRIEGQKYREQKHKRPIAILTTDLMNEQRYKCMQFILYILFCLALM